MWRNIRGFLPLCQGLTVRRRSTLPDGREVLVADMKVGFKAIRESFTSRVTLNRAANVIVAEYIDGPFRSLENRWTFRRPSTGGRVDRLYGRVLHHLRVQEPDARPAHGVDVRRSAFSRFAEAFEQRADKVYG